MYVNTLIHGNVYFWARTSQGCQEKWEPCSKLSTFHPTYWFQLR